VVSTAAACVTSYLRERTRKRALHIAKAIGRKSPKQARRAVEAIFAAKSRAPRQLSWSLFRRRTGR
jgi:hypothetical protein